MKRLILMLLALCLFCACSAPTEPSSAAQESEIPAEEPVEEPIAEEVPIPMDAALYRGVLAGKEGEALLLEQAYGTDFGAPSLRVVLDEHTRANVDIASLQPGEYLEVYYGSGGAMPEEATAISLNRLVPADLCLFNGTILELMDDDANSLLLQAIGGENQIVFHCDEQTQYYLNQDALAVGDRLNVYFDGRTTRSLPPQATAMEIRPFYEAESSVQDNPVTAGPSESASGPVVAPAADVTTGTEPTLELDGTLRAIPIAASYPVDSPEIQVVLENRTAEEIGIGLYYQIQRQTESGWETLPLEFAVIDIAMLVPSGGTATQTFSLHQDQYEYTPGHYRLMWKHAEDIPAEFTLE